MIRKVPLVVGEVYHIFSRSIADFTIFNQKNDYLRIMHLLMYYRVEEELRFSKFIEIKRVKNSEFFREFAKNSNPDRERVVDVIAYCIMPTHIHLLLKQLKEGGISWYIGNILNSYSRYFNNKYRRKGPLWESKFKNVLVKDDKQLQHLTRYIHLNPTTANLIKKPEDWEFSSYLEYLSHAAEEKRICNFDDIVEIKPKQYRKFVNERKTYQRDLALIKKVAIDLTM